VVDPIGRDLTVPDHSQTCDDLIGAYRYLCKRASRKFWRSGLERSDLEQVAAVGLIKAARRFDPSTRTPFEAYAWIAIVGELMHYVRDHESVVRVPRRLRALETHYVRAHETLVGRLGREPHEREIASEMGIVATMVAEVRRARATARPLDIEEAAGADLHDRRAVSFEDSLLVRSAFSALPPFERQVIAGVYLLGLTQHELARRLGLRPKAVSRLHRAALVRMQQAWAS